MDNLYIWRQKAAIDPRFTKPITGRPYKGTSPNPQHIVQCLTELFGPVGKGFGWAVEAEAFEKLADEVLHWCRITFWWSEGAARHSVQQYGQTKTVYKSRDGKTIVDEDAPKKSLTDAIVKAASHLGIASEIFLGRYDDQKYVTNLEGEFREAEREAERRAAPPVELVTEEQWRELEDLIPASGKPLSVILNAYGIDKLSDLPAAKYEGTRARLLELAEAQKAEAAPQEAAQ